MMGEKCYRNVKSQAGKPAYMKDGSSVHIPINRRWFRMGLIGDVWRLDEKCCTTNIARRTPHSECRPTMPCCLVVARRSLISAITSHHEYEIKKEWTWQWSQGVLPLSRIAYWEGQKRSIKLPRSVHFPEHKRGAIPNLTTLVRSNDRPIISLGTVLKSHHFTISTNLHPAR